MSVIREVNLDTLKELDGGKAWHAFQQHIRRAAIDCLDRPGDDKARKVVLEIELSPVLDAQSLECSEVTAKIQASSTVPKHRTKKYSFGLRRNGSLVFNVDAPDNVNQTTFLEDGEDA